MRSPSALVLGVLLALPARADEPQVLRTTQLRFTSAERARRELEAPPGVPATVTVDARTNRVVMSGSSAGIETTSRVLRRIDAPAGRWKAVVSIETGTGPTLKLVWAATTTLANRRPASFDVEAASPVAGDLTKIAGQLAVADKGPTLAASFHVTDASGTVLLEGKAKAAAGAIPLATKGAYSLSVNLTEDRPDASEVSR